jgi:Las1-like
VYRALSSGDITDKRRALNVIEVWKSRGRIPVAIEGTYNIVGVMLRDSYFHPNSELAASDDELRSLYSIHIIRAVNAVVDIAQKGAVAMSVEGLAKSLGIPGWVVELRHEATHGPKLPPLSSLRLAADHLLSSFFLPQYWQAQERLVTYESAETLTEAEILTLLDNNPSDADLKLICKKTGDESVIIHWAVSQCGNPPDNFQHMLSVLLARLSERFLPNLIRAAPPQLLTMLLEISNPRLLRRHALTTLRRRPCDAALFHSLRRLL